MRVIKKGDESGSTWCDECHIDKGLTIHLGMEPDYDSNTVFICKECLTKAINLINETI